MTNVIRLIIMLAFFSLLRFEPLNLQVLAKTS